VADCEHFAVELVQEVRRQGRFDLLVPMPNQPYLQKRMRAIPPEQFSRRWAGLATAKVPYHFARHADLPLHLFAQRCGERPQDYRFKGFLSTRDADEVRVLAGEFPKRWHIEEFFNIHQDLGWKRAGTQNLHIRYGQMTLALLAQGALAQLRQRLDEPIRQWTAKRFASDFLRGLDGDLRVWDDTIVVTFYGASELASCRHHFEHLPRRLEAEGLDPRIPWLYNYQLDFRFK